MSNTWFFSGSIALPAKEGIEGMFDGGPSSRYSALTRINLKAAIDTHD